MSTIAAPPAGMARQPATAVIGYGLGDVANNLAFATGTTFLLLYYTDVAGFAPAAIAALFFVVRLWDAVAEVIAGRLVSRTTTRWGRFRPFILFLAVPVGFLSLLTFSVPAPGVRWLGLVEWPADLGVQLLYAFLTYAALGLAYSLVNIPYGSLAPAMTQSVHERAKLVSARAVGAAVGALFITAVIAPQIAAVHAARPLLPNADAARGRVVTPEQAQATWESLGAATYADAAAVHLQRLQGVFTSTTLAFIVIGTICYALTFWWCREAVVREPVAPTTWQSAIATLKANPPLRVLCLAAFFYLVGLFAVGGSLAFYARHVLGSLSYLPVIILVSSGVSLLVTPLIPTVVARLGKKAVFQFCGLLTVIGGVGLWFVPTADPGSTRSTIGSLGLVLMFLALKAIGDALIITVMFSLGADTIEYGQWTTGVRTESATYAVLSFLRKSTQAVGGAVGALMLQLGGYLVGTSLAEAGGVQPLAAVEAIKFTIGPIPAICAVFAMLIFVTYPLTDRLMSQIRDENEASKLARAVESSADNDLS